MSLKNIIFGGLATIVIIIMLVSLVKKLVGTFLFVGILAVVGLLVYKIATRDSSAA